MNFNGLSGKQGREQMQNRKMPEEVVLLVLKAKRRSSRQR